MYRAGFYYVVFLAGRQVAFIECVAKLLHKNHQFPVIHFFARLFGKSAPALLFRTRGHIKAHLFARHFS